MVEGLHKFGLDMGISGDGIVWRGSGRLYIGVMCGFGWQGVFQWR